MFLSHNHKKLLDTCLCSCVGFWKSQRDLENHLLSRSCVSHMLRNVFCVVCKNASLMMCLIAAWSRHSLLEHNGVTLQPSVRSRTFPALKRHMRSLECSRQSSCWCLLSKCQCGISAKTVRFPFQFLQRALQHNWCLNLSPPTQKSFHLQRQSGRDLSWTSYISRVFGHRHPDAGR